MLNRKIKTFFIAASALIPIAIGILVFLTLAHSPYFGIELEKKNNSWIISSIDPKGPFYKAAGDLKNVELTGIGGWQVGPEDLAQEPHLIKDKKILARYFEAQIFIGKYLTNGTPAILQVRDGNEMRGETVVPSPMGYWNATLRIGAFSVTALLLLLVGLVTVHKRPQDERALVFYLMCILFSSALPLFALFFAQELIVTNVRMFSGLLFAAGLFTVATAFHFALIFPERKRLVGRGLLIFVYLLPMLTWLLTFFQIDMALQHLYVIGYESATMIILLYSFFTSSSPIHKAQIKWVLMGLAVPIMIPLLLVYLPLQLTGRPFFNDQSFIALDILMPLFFAFAILRYRLLDVDTLFDNTLIYTGTLGLLALLDIVIVTALTQLKFMNFNISQPIAIIIGVWMIIIAYLPIRNWIRDKIKRLLKRELYNIENVALKLSRDLISAQTVASVLEKGRIVIDEALHPKKMELCLNGNQGTLALAQNTILLTDEFHGLKKAQPLLTENVPAYAGGAVVPIIGSVGPLGYGILAEKHSGRLYNAEDLNLLDTVAGQLAIAIESIRNRQEMEKEKERIAREIHDGIGGYFSSAIMMSDMIHHNDVSNDLSAVKDRSEKLKVLLQSGLMELRDLIWSTEQGEDTLESLAYYLEGKLQSFLDGTGIEHETQIKLVKKNYSVPPAIRLNLLKMLQESLTNIIKHASATKVTFSLRQRDNHLLFSVADNGKGFNPQNPSVQGHGLKNLSKRAEQIGAKLELESKPGQGTKVMVRLSL